MGKEQSYQNAAKEILRLIGGKENVISAAHCATRLRLVLKNEKLADVDGILSGAERLTKYTSILFSMQNYKKALKKK